MEISGCDMTLYLLSLVPNDAIDKLSKVDKEKDYHKWLEVVPFIYDLCMMYTLSSSCPSIQWIQNRAPSARDNMLSTFQTMFISTDMPGHDDNFLYNVSIQIPCVNAEIDLNTFDEEGNTDQKKSKREMNGKLDTRFRINVGEAVQSLKYTPNDSDTVAVSTQEGKIYVFDLQCHCKSPASNEVNPQYIMGGCRDTGRSLSWSHMNDGFLASGGDDGIIYVWDVLKAPNVYNVRPLFSYHGSHSVVNCVSWHPLDYSLLSSCGSDGCVHIYDIRQSSASTIIQAHKCSITALSFNPFEKQLMLTAASDGVICLWDDRNMSTPLHQLTGHVGEVTAAEWSQFNGSVFATGGSDGRVCIWDLNRIGMDSSSDDVTEGIPELLFVHGGHTSRVNDISWNPNGTWMLCSVANDNTMHIWQPAEHIYNPALESLTWRV